MEPEHHLDQDQLRQRLGGCQQRIFRLENDLARLKDSSREACREWNRLLSHRQDLFDWLLDQAVNPAGRLVTPSIDSALGGESFIPCTFTDSRNGRRYRIDLISTAYQIMDVDDLGR